MPAAIATHAVLSRLGSPIRVCTLGDWQSLADMRAAASLSIGIYTLAEVTVMEAARAEGVIAAAAILASPEWRIAA